MRWILVWGALLGGMFGAAWYYREELKTFAESHRPRPTPARSVAYAPPGEEIVHAVGFVEGAAKTADLRFEMAGRLVEICVSEGQQVYKGQVLARLDSVLLEQEVAQAEADLRLANAEWIRLNNAARPETRFVAQAQVLVAKAAVEDCQDEATRIKKLYDRKGATEGEWMDAYHALQIAKARLAEKQAMAQEVEAPARQDDLKVAQSKVEVAKAALEYAKLRLEKTKLTAPSAGTILHLAAEAGEMVGPDDSEPVFRFANLDRIRVRAYVEEFHALKIAEGDPVQATAEGLPGQTFAGQIIFCSPWMNEKQHRTHKPHELLDVKTREVLIELENAQTLVVGFPVEVMIKLTSPSAPSGLLESTNGPTKNPDNINEGIPDRDRQLLQTDEPGFPQKIGFGKESHENPRNYR